MNRRHFLFATGSALAGGTLAAVALHRSADIPGLPELRTRLDALRGKALVSHTAWSPAEVLEHLAQSVEYSLTGYPEAKPAVFQQTVGRAAFEAFQYTGAMRHSLTEPIPGAPALDAALPVDAALDRLLAALTAFEQHAGPIAPHFAFGALSHAEFSAAHVLHIENHLTRLVVS